MEASTLRPDGTYQGASALIDGTMRRTKEAIMRPLILCCVLLSVLCAGCGSTRAGRETAVAVTTRAYQASNATVVSSARQAQRKAFLDDLDRAEQKWQSLGIRNYRLGVYKGNPFDGPRDITIVVTDNRVVTTPALCQAVHAPNCLFGHESVDEFTIPALFAKVRRDLQEPSRAIDWLTFDETYGYPKEFGSNADPSLKVSESRYLLKVYEFTVLP